MSDFSANLDLLTADAEVIRPQDVWVGDEILVAKTYRGVIEMKHGAVAKISKQGGLQTAHGEFLIAPRNIHNPVTVYLLHRDAKPLPTTNGALIKVDLLASHVAGGRPGLYRYSSSEGAWFTFGSAQRFMPGDFREWSEAAA